MMRKNVLVFPCGSEIGLEVHRSLRYSRHINLVGASSINDHGRFVYENYINTVPFVEDESFIPTIAAIIEKHEIDAIYPCMDSVIKALTEAKDSLGCRIISSPYETVNICFSKKNTYDHLREIIPIPKIYDSIEKIVSYPVFMKPEVSYGTRGAKIIFNRKQAEFHMEENPNCLILEYLPGHEYTVDCFSNKYRTLQFVGPRPRRRISNGISVNTVSMMGLSSEFHRLAQKINDHLIFRGAWFFQVKENDHGELVLMEVAPRLGGSSSLYRNLGVNFALLSIFDAFEEDVLICLNEYSIELDRALNNTYKLDLTFEEVYTDLDDCLLIDEKVNTQFVAFLYQCMNKKIKVTLLTKHDGSLDEVLRKYKLSELFDSIVHLQKEAEKSDLIKNKNAIFIDDSFLERKKVRDRCGIPVFAPDMIECLLDL